MFEIDDYFDNERPISSTRNIEFILSAKTPYNFSDLKMNGKDLELELDKNSNEKTKNYKAQTSTLKSYEYEGIKQSYADMIYFEITSFDNEIVDFTVKSKLNGFLSDDEIITLNPTNSMSLEELRKSDNFIDNSISAICNGYESIVTLKKTENNKINLNFTVATMACALYKVHIL